MTDFDYDELMNDSYRTYREFSAGPGDVLLRKHPEWSPPNDCEKMTVPEMIAHIFRHRKGHAVAPNGHTTPFLTTEEWVRIANWARTGNEEDPAL
jgi:hypothetical protein